MVSYVLVCLFLFDCSVFGGGHYLSVGPLTPRILIGFLAAVLALPKLLKNWKTYLKKPVIWTTAAFAVYLGICLVRGIQAGNRTNVIVSDIKGFMWLFLVPVLLVAVNSRKRFDRLLDVVLVGGLVQSLIVFAVNIYCTVVYHGVNDLHDPVKIIQLGTVSIISGNIYRIFMRSVPYLVAASAIAIFKQAQQKKLCFRYVCCIAVYLNALLLSFTRSVYGCAAVVAVCSVILLFVFYRKNWKQHLKFLGAAAGLTVALVFVLEFAFSASYFNFALSRTLGIEPRTSVAVSLRVSVDQLLDKYDISDTLDREDDFDPSEELEQQQGYLDITEKSDALRAKTVSELKALIRRNPIFGNGLGASAPSREDGLDEYFYLDVLARMGVVGLILYILPFGYVLWVCLRNRAMLFRHPDACAVLCGMVGFWVITWFNPWMNAVLGIAWYAVSTVIPELLKSDADSEREVSL